MKSSRKSILDQFKAFYDPKRTKMKEVLDFLDDQDLYYIRRFEDSGLSMTEKDAHDLLEFYNYFMENCQVEFAEYEEKTETIYEVYIFRLAQEIIMKRNRGKEQALWKKAADWQRIEADRLADQLFERNEALTLQLRYSDSTDQISVPDISTIHDQKGRDDTFRGIRYALLQWILDGNIMAVEYPAGPSRQVSFIRINNRGRWEPMTQYVAEVTGTLQDYRICTGYYADYREFPRKLSDNVIYLTELTKLRREEAD